MKAASWELGSLPSQLLGARAQPKSFPYTLVIICVALALALYTALRPVNSVLSASIRYSILGLSFFTFLESSLRHFFRRQELAALLSKLSRRSSPPKRFLAFTLLCWTSGLLMRCIEWYFSPDKPPMKRIINYFLSLALAFEIFSFSTILQRAAVAFEETSRVLAIVLSNNRPRQATILRLLVIYSNVCDVCDKLNEFYSLQLICLMTLNFINFVVHMYFTLETNKGFYAVGTHFIWFIMSLNNIIGISVISSKVTRKANDFNDLLYHCMLKDLTNTLAANKNVQLHLTMKREVFFTAFGLFKLNMLLVHSVLAASANYLLLLLQFGNH